MSPGPSDITDLYHGVNDHRDTSEILVLNLWMNYTLESNSFSWTTEHGYMYRLYHGV